MFKIRLIKLKHMDTVFDMMDTVFFMMGTQFSSKAKVHTVRKVYFESSAQLVQY